MYLYKTDVFFSHQSLFKVSLKDGSLTQVSLYLLMFQLIDQVKVLGHSQPIRVMLSLPVFLTTLNPLSGLPVLVHIL